MFAIGGFCKAYKSIVSKRNSSQQEKNKGSEHKGRHGERAEEDDEEDFVSQGFFKRLENLPQSNKDSPIKRSTSLGSNSSFSRSMSKNRRNPVSAAANHLFRMVSNKNMDSSSKTTANTAVGADTANEFNVNNLDYSSNDELGTGNASLPRSLSQNNMTRSSSQRQLGRSLSRKYSQKGGSVTPEVHAAIADPGPPTPTPTTEKSMSRSISRQGTVPIMFSSSNGLLKPPAIERTLDCSLEELCFGSVKKITVSRDVINDIGFLTQEEEQLTIKVEPGWSEGTRITFPGTGNGKLGTCPGDVILVVAEKRHPMYSRQGDEDLELAVEISLVDALTGCSIKIPLLGGENVKLELDYVIKPGMEKIIPGQGMPKQNDQPNKNRGNLVLKFLVAFPHELSEEQRQQVYTILSPTTDE